MENTYHMLNPYVRLKESELLSQEQLHALIRTKDKEEIQQGLKATAYGEYFSESPFSEIDDSLDDALDHLVRQLLERAPDPRVIWLYTMRATFHNLKVLLKGELLEKNFDHLCLRDGLYSIDQLKTAIRTGGGVDLPEVIRVSIEKVKQHFEESTSVQGIDIILDRNYLWAQHTLAQSLDVPEIKEEVRTFIDFTNLTMMARGIKQKRTKNFLSTVLSSFGSIPKEEILAYSSASLEEFSEYLSTSDYAESVQQTDGKKLDIRSFERAGDDYMTEFYERAQTEAFGPLPVLALLHAKTVEVRNLRVILTGKRVGLSQEQIKERMRDSYGT